MTAIVYLDRDNSFTLDLTQDGSAPVAGAIIRSALHIPASATESGNPLVVDTDGANAELLSSGTRVSFTLGGEALRIGPHTCYLVNYEAASVNGIAWDEVQIVVKDWPETA